MRYYFRIEHTYGDTQTVWVDANSKEEAEAEIRREYHSICKITLVKTQK